jgi:ADP-ribose pyrophosphatase
MRPSPPSSPFPSLGIKRDDAVEVHATEILHRGFMDYSRLRLSHARFDGSRTPMIEREVCHRRRAVAVILYDPEADALVMVEQFRAGAFAGGENPWMLEFVAGIVKDGESPDDVATREAMEEAGCTVRALRLIYSMMPSPGGSTEIVDLFIGLVESAAAGGLHGLIEEDEDIRVHRLAFADAIAMMDAGLIGSGFTLLGLNWLARQHGALRQGR